MKLLVSLGFFFGAILFLPGQEGPISAFSPSGGVDGQVYAVLAQPDGKIVLGGQFSAVNNTPRRNIARLNGDGTLDPTFLAKETDGLDGTVYSLALQADGGIVVGGLFSNASQVERRNLARYAADGALDPAFGAKAAPNGQVLGLAVAPNGDVIAGGQFSEVASQPRRNVAAFAADGTLKPVLGGVNGVIQKLGLLPNGSVIAVGNFSPSEQNGANVSKLPH